jgi:hypothetical protein
MELLGRPRFTLSRLRRAYFEAYVEAVLLQLEHEPSLSGWERERQRRCTTLAIRNHTLDPSPLAEYIPAPPETWLGRDLWLERHAAGFHSLLEDARASIRQLVFPLLRTVGEPNHDWLLGPTIVKLLNLARGRPALMATIDLACRRFPAVLVDLLFVPETAPWATKIVADYSLPHGSYDQKLVAEKGSAGRLESFEDALALVFYHLQSGDPAAVREYAELARWLFGSRIRQVLSGPEVAADPRELTVFITAARELPRDALIAILGFLVEGPESGLGTAGFAAALELVNLHHLHETTEPDAGALERLRTAYLRTFEKAPDYAALSFDHSAAYALAATFRAGGDAAWAKFLRPVPFQEQVRDLLGLREPERYRRAGALEQAIRTHLRILCRALQTWENTGPDDLCDAILELARVGSHESLPTGQVAVFRAFHETGLFYRRVDRPLAVDLALAIGRMPGDRQETFLSVAFEFKDARAVSQLCSNLPKPVGHTLQTRLLALTPEFAPDDHTLTDVHARIDALLELKCVDLAERYIAQERDFSTIGRVPQRSLARYVWQLRIDYIRGNRIAVALPADLIAEDDFAAEDRRDAERSRRFYAALQDLTLPDGDPQAAAAAFHALAEEYDHALPYVANWFAAVVQATLGRELLRHPALPTRPRILAILEQGEKLYAKIPASLSSSDYADLAINRAFLLLAAEEPQRALDELLGLPEEARQGSKIEALVATTRARLGLITVVPSHEQNTLLERLAVVDSDNPRARFLTALLASIFPNSQALHRWIDLDLPDSHAIMPELPSPASADYRAQAVMVLYARGYVDPGLFTELRQYVPRRVAEISAVEQLCLVDLPR